VKIAEHFKDVYLSMIAIVYTTPVPIFYKMIFIGYMYTKFDRNKLMYYIHTDVPRAVNK
jgi:hypothetical protein